jgi:hypothetical protein
MFVRLNLTDLMAACLLSYHQKNVRHPRVLAEKFLANATPIEFLAVAEFISNADKYQQSLLRPSANSRRALSPTERNLRFYEGPKLVNLLSLRLFAQVWGVRVRVHLVRRPITQLNRRLAQSYWEQLSHFLDGWVVRLGNDVNIGVQQPICE